MFDFRHKLKNGTLFTTWEPGLFTLPGVLFLWAGLIALHRLASRGAYGVQTVPVVLCSLVLFLAGILLCLGRAGYLFSPKENRWGFWTGLLRPFVFFRHALDPVEKVALQEEPLNDKETAYLFVLKEQKEHTIGITGEAAVAFSVAESMAAFLHQPLAYESYDSRKNSSFDPPAWGQLASFSDETGTASRGKPKNGTITAGPQFGYLKARGPLLLGLFMTFVLYLAWDAEHLSSSVWGLAATLFALVLLAWGLVNAVLTFFKKQRISIDKTGITLTQSFPTKQTVSVSWNDLAYCALIPHKMGFLGMTGRDKAIVLAPANGTSFEIGAHMTIEELADLHAYLSQQGKRLTG